MKTRILARATAFALSFLMLATTAVFADQITGDVDGDAVASPHNNALTANQQPGTTMSYDFSALVKETGNAADDVFRSGHPEDTVSISVTRAGDWLASPAGTPASLSYSSYDSSESGTISVLVPCNTAAGTVEVMTVDLLATASNGHAFSTNGDSLHLTYTVTALGSNAASCPPVGPTDTDDDGVDDDDDNCPIVANADQADTDVDGTGDACDSDDDNDGDLDEVDNCPLVANADQVDVDNDGVGDACDPLIDNDGDGIANADDNCPSVSNVGQENADGDSLGDACDSNSYAPAVFTSALDDAGDEGDTLQTSGAFSDQDGNTSLTISQVSGAGTVTDNGDGTWSWSFPTTDNGSGTVVVKASDGEHTDATDSFDWSAANVAPSGTLGNDGPVFEGSSATVSFSGATDPSSVDTTAGFKFDFSCSNDTSALSTTYAGASASASTTCSYADEGSYTVAGRIFDKDNGYRDYTTTVVVDNANPVVAAPSWSSATIKCGTSATLTGISFSDAGVNDDPWTVAIDIDGDGDSDYTRSSVSAQGAQPNQSHTFSTPGTYTATVTVTDEDGGQGSNSSDSLTVAQAYSNSFLQPIENLQTTGKKNTFKNGRVIPVKVTITDDCTGDAVTGSTGETVTVFLVKTPIAGSGTDAIETFADAGASSGNTNLFRWSADGFWIYNLDSKALDMTSGATYELKVKIDGIAASMTAALSPTR